MTAYAKALAAGLSALIAGLILGLDDDSLVLREWLQAVGQAIAVGSAVYFAPRNADPDEGEAPE